MFNSALYSKFAYILPYSLTIQESFCSLVNKPTFVRHLGFSRWFVQRHLPITNYSFIVCYMNSRLLNLCSAERCLKTSWMTSCNLISLGKDHGRSQWKYVVSVNLGEIRCFMTDNLSWSFLSRCRWEDFHSAVLSSFFLPEIWYSSRMLKQFW